MDSGTLPRKDNKKKQSTATRLNRIGIEIGLSDKINQFDSLEWSIALLIKQ